MSADEPEREEETSAEWLARQDRETRSVRLGCGVVAGLVVAMLLLARFGGNMPWFVSLPILAGCIIIFVVHFIGDDHRAASAMEWLVFPEFKILSNLPWWLIAVVTVLLFALLFGFAAVLLLSR